MVMMHARALCATSLSDKAEAEECVAEYASIFCNIDVKKIMHDTCGWKEGATTALSVGSQMIEDENEEALSTVEEEEGMDGEDVLEDDVDLSAVPDAYVAEKDLAVEMFSCDSETSLESSQKRYLVVASLRAIVEKRISTFKGIIPSNIPLTSRPVERMFSGWRRLMDKSSFTRSSTAQAMFLLKDFEPSEVLSMLKEVPFTKAIQTYLRRLKEEDNQANLDKVAFERTLKNSQESKMRLIERKRLTDVAEQYSIMSYLTKARKKWTIAHSMEFFQKCNIELSTMEKKSSAESLKKLVFETFARKHPNKWPVGSLSFNDRLDLTHVPSDSSTNLQIEPQAFEVEEIVNHKVQGKSKYLCILFFFIFFYFEKQKDTNDVYYRVCISDQVEGSS
jgi:hypothetical protein